MSRVLVVAAGVLWLWACDGTSGKGDVVDAGPEASIAVPHDDGAAHADVPHIPPRDAPDDFPESDGTHDAVDDAHDAPRYVTDAPVGAELLP